jgi:hypothetical protein
MPTRHTRIPSCAMSSLLVRWHDGCRPRAALSQSTLLDQARPVPCVCHAPFGRFSPCVAVPCRRSAPDDNFGLREGKGCSHEDPPEVWATDTANRNLAPVVPVDWREVAHFDGQLIARHSYFDIERPEKFRAFVSKDPCDLFLAFFPMELVEPCFEHWRAQGEHDLKGLKHTNMYGISGFVVEDGADRAVASRALLHRCCRSFHHEPGRVSEFAVHNQGRRIRRILGRITATRQSHSVWL